MFQTSDILNVLLLIALLATLQAQPDLPSCSAPHLELARRNNFTLCHDASRKVPAWTAYTLTPQQLATPSHPRPSRFRQDESLRTPGAHDTDYTHTGFHRGHLVPALDRDNSPETFLLSNAAPQTPSLNLGKMRQLENLIRTLAATSDSITVITGTLFESPTPETIGLNQVAVPSHFYKAILISRGTNRTMLAAILPNSSRIAAPLSHFLTTVDEVERRSDLDLFSSLPDDEEAALEASRPDRDHMLTKESFSFPFNITFRSSRTFSTSHAVSSKSKGGFPWKPAPSEPKHSKTLLAKMDL